MGVARRCLFALACSTAAWGGVNQHAIVTLRGVRTAVWRPAGAAAAPLVVFSHGLHGSAIQSRSLCRALAAAGYLVVSPDHRDSIFWLGGTLFKPYTRSPPKPRIWDDSIYRDRANDVRAVLDALKSDATWSRAIDRERVALVGHSLGGYTMLGLAGAWPSWKIGGVRAVLAFSPHVSPLLKSGVVGAIGVPVMYQTGTRDWAVSPSLTEPSGAFARTPAPCYLVDVRGADHFSFSDRNASGHAAINACSIRFLDAHVKGAGPASGLSAIRGVASVKSK